MRVCSEPSCPNLTQAGRCAEHRRQADRRRGTAAERGYDKRWRRTRALQLRAYPLCQNESGCHELATEVHHLDGLGPLGLRGHDFTNLQSLCGPHHSQITARMQPGGFNAR